MLDDYVAPPVSLRGHPVRFLRERLDAMKIVRCADIHFRVSDKQVLLFFGMRSKP